MRQFGFRPMPLGPDNEASRRAAMTLYERWIKVRDAGPVPDDDAPRTKEQASAAKVYLPGSIGEAWQKWIKSDEWARLAPANRNKIWWEAWLKRIEPVFADVAPDSVTMEDLSAWRQIIEASKGLDAAHKALKVWRAFWPVMKAMRYTQLSDPSEKIINRQPPPRTARFSHGEAMRLAKTAWRLGYRGLACVIVVAWDTGFSPQDVRTLRPQNIGVDPKTGRMIFDKTAKGRGKTGVAVIGTLSKFGALLVEEYFRRSPPPEAGFLFRMRTGVPYQQNRLGIDFATVRASALPTDKRQLRDMRRSGVMEAFTGGAGAQDIAEKFGNTLDRSSTLFKTYNPVDLEKVRQADSMRLEGRRRRNRK